MDRLDGPLRVLDPACGDGNLLCAIAEVLPKAKRKRATLIGIENDSDSFVSLAARQPEFGRFPTDLIKGDFLEFVGGDDLFSGDHAIAPVDIIIANPPYVRTQVLGARRAQQLAARFGLSGRVDLYQAFLVAMARQLRPGGILGVITSNRFLTTRSGISTRRFLRANFDLAEIIDLGDTKLFEAAVLPALVFAKKRDGGEGTGQSTPSFIRIYETSDDPMAKAGPPASLLECLRHPASGVFHVNGSAYRMTTGRLPLPLDDDKPWTLLTDEESEWVARIDAASECRISDVAKVRVGIKTTADDVFVRRDWDSLPPETRPERRYLRALLCQEDAAKWKAIVPRGPRKRVLYTHELLHGRRRAIQFDERSTTWNYLLRHRRTLESREYVLDAGRAWYEIWVPQDPAAWSLPKAVFPDISPGPKFFLDTDGCVVDGNCYWITTNDSSDEDLLLLIIAVANSALMARYHDLAFQNRLYAQRRRHLTQYVKEYPLPPRDTKASRQLVSAARRLVRREVSNDERRDLESEVDRLAELAFGLKCPAVMDRRG
jgi:hypothetical protein